MYRKDKKEEFYTKKAKEEGYPARSVYKLKEIDEEFRIIRRGDWVLDLGSAPGSWIMYTAEKIGRQGKVFGFDVEDIKAKGENMVFFKKSILDPDTLNFLKDKKFNCVLADLSPKTTGIRSLDSGLSLELSERAFFIAQKVLKKNGNFVCKIFESADAGSFVKNLSLYFKNVKRFRPKAVLKKSKEFYIVAKGFIC